MAEEDDWKKLPIEEKVVHKIWKCRVAGYEEAAKKFRYSHNDKDPDFNIYLPLMKKFVIDSNAVAQEKGLEAVFAFLENAACAPKCCEEVVSGIVLKVLNARPKTKQRGIDICMMFLELEKQEVVMEELVKGFTNKQPKIVAATVQTCTKALSEFGGKVIKMKNLVQSIPTLLGHSDKTVREETKALAIEIYKWIRDAIKPQLQNIKPVQMKELEDEWAKLDPAPPQPTRFTKSEQAKQAAAPPPPVAATSGDDEGGHSAAAPAAPVIDAWELFDPVEILSKLPKDFFEQVESKKWLERKEALEALDKLTSNPKLENGQYGEVCAVLKKVITKDSNINVVAVAAKCVTGLANGLRKKFGTYSQLLIPAIFGKFKEKKLVVVISLRDAVDACFLTTNFTNIMEDLLASLDNKNPSIKEETCKFLTRAFSTMPPATFTKGLMKQILPAVIAKLEDTVGTIRDAAADCLGTAMKLVGEKMIAPYIEPLDKIRQEKIKEFYEKAEVTASGGAAAPAAAAPAAKPAATVKKPEVKEVKNEPAATKPAKKPGGKPKAAGKKVPKKTTKEGKKKKSGNDFAADEVEPTESEMNDCVIDDKAEELFGAERLKMIASNNWKERLEGVQQMGKIDIPADVAGQVIVRTLAKKPGWKDSNFQVLNAKFKMLADVASTGNISRRSSMYAISGLISKIGDLKLKTQVKETLKIFAENISLNYVSLKVAKAAEEGKNPKLQTEALVWMNESVKEFGFRINLKPHVEFIKKQLAHVNPGVRKAAIEFLATLHMYVGASIRMFFEDEKPALLQQIDAEFAKVQDEKPPAPTRKFRDDEDEEETVDAAADGGEGDEGGGPVVSMEDMVDRIDISNQLTDEMLKKIMDKNWKIRKEGLEEVQAIVTAAKFIAPEIGELLTPLKARLCDNNKVLVAMALAISKQLAECGGSGMAKHKGIILPAIIGTLSDAKPHLRKQGEEALDAWHSKIGFLPLLDNEILSTALRETNPNLKASLLGWLEKKLPNEKKLPAELKESIAPLYACLEDRNPEVRKCAQACVPLFMAHIGYEPMSKATTKLSPISQPTVQGLLEKARETVVPIQTKGKVKSVTRPPAVVAAPVEDVKEMKEQEKQEKKKADPKDKEKPAKPGAKKPTKPVSRAKNEVVDEGPALIHKVGKADRAKDEKKLKVLKWNFTTPRGEIVDQLKEQMVPIFSATMHTKLFHSDFKFHIEAIIVLTKAVTEQPEAITESLDLILKWVTLRFFDTNTSVLLKVLDFLTELFKMLESNEYKFTNLESSAFMPYLILKIGDPKDNVRKSIRDLLKVITLVCPASKVFTYLMEGLTSKNSKTRMECCEELGFLISKFGIDVCQPNPKILKEVAAQIADRDNGVRSAALNCIVEAYNIVGESVYKLIGRLNDKDMGYLEERIKRKGKEQAAEPVKPRMIKGGERPKTAKMPEVADIPPEMAHNTGTYKVQKRNQPGPCPIKREFELDLIAIEGDEYHRIIADSPKLATIDMNAVNEAASIPEHLFNRYVNMYNTKKNGANQVIEKASIRDTGAILDLTIAKISSADMQTAMESLVQLEEMFKRKKTEDEILKRIDQYLVTSLVQFKMLISRHVENKEYSKEDVERLLKLLLSGMLVLFNAKCYSTVVSRNVLKDVIYFFITVLSDKVLEKFEEADLSIQCVNKLLLRVITNADKTNSFGACIKLLQDLSENINTPQSVMRLLMKCVWKLTHLLPDIINELNLNVILVDIHTFYKVLPPAFWKNRDDRVPQQTMKALLQTLCKLRGGELVDCLSSIEDPGLSELAQYVLRHCPKGKLASLQNNQNVPPDKKYEPTNFGEPSDEILVEIFKKIGSKENARAGINDLYHFKKRYPTYDVDPFIKSTTPFFQNFIDRSLKMIAEDEMAKCKQDYSTETPSQAIRNDDSSISSDSAQYLDRLNALKDKFKKANRVPEPAPEIPIPEITPDPEVKKETSVPEIKYTEEKEKNSFDLGDIRNRLEQIKMGIKPS